MKAVATTVCLVVLSLFACVRGTAWSGENRALAAQVEALRTQYESLLKFRDFSSFSKRMQAIRDLGNVRCPASRDLLVRIADKAKLIDDQVVAIISVGPQLDTKCAKKLGTIVGRRPTDVLVEVLGESYAQIEDKSALTWLATEALEGRRSTVEAALSAQYVHGDARAVQRVRDVYARYAPHKKHVAIAYAAVRALGSIGGQRVRPYILRAAGHADWRIRLACADVLARQKPFDEVNIAPTLTKLLNDDEQVVRQAAAQGIGLAKLAEMVPEVAALLVEPNTRTRAVAHEVLRSISGKDIGFDPEDWINWWNNRSAEVALPKGSSSVATYYGVGVNSDRLLFIVDLSGSMAFPWGQDDTRIVVARDELTRVLKRLPPRKSGPERLGPPPLFNLIVFSDKVKAWRKGETEATGESVDQALQWVSKNFEAPRGGTYMHAALEKAFRENPRIDTIFLLTDGLATDGTPIVPEAILASVNIWNRYRRVVIHTVALTLEELDKTGQPKRDLAEIKKFMRQVATVTGGESRVVTKPPRKR